MRVYASLQMLVILTTARFVVEDLYMGFFSWDRYVVHQVVMRWPERSLIPKNVPISGPVRVS